MIKTLFAILFCSSCAFAFDYTLYTGCYDDTDQLAHSPSSTMRGSGISTLSMSQDGRLALVDITPMLNPAVLHIHPQEPILYALTETIKSESEIIAFDIGEDKRLSRRQIVKPTGLSTCFMAIDNKGECAIATSYWNSFVDVIALDHDGSMKTIIQSFQQTDGKNHRQVKDREDHLRNRQVGPHAHSALIWENFVFIPDLGINAIFQYRHTKEGLLYEEMIELPSRAGPRHMVINPRLHVLYVSNELNNTVSVGRLDGGEPSSKKRRINFEQHLSTLPNGADVVSHVAEVSMSPDARFLYVSNRGHNSIAVYAINQDTGLLNFIETFASGGECPRHFAISPDGKFIVVANQNSNSLVVFPRDIEHGTVGLAVEKMTIGTPNFVRFY